jgi:hypothetical protein
MSEYQFLAFRAIDAPVTAKNLQYMRDQSTRADVTEWSFENEYHFGDFHGDAEGMLRRGYDFHLHYANFGYRNLMMRFPSGLPDARASKAYFKNDSVHFEKDSKGPGGILRIEPYFEAGELDELWDPPKTFESLLPLRAELLEGDLRPLYLAHLAVCRDGNHDREEEKDAPVPAGLNKLTKAQSALAKFYGIDKKLLTAAARNSPPLSREGNAKRDYAAWLATQPTATKDAWLSQLMTDAHSAVRSEVLAAYQKENKAPIWPTARIDRTIAELEGDG